MQRRALLLALASLSGVSVSQPAADPSLALRLKAQLRSAAGPRYRPVVLMHGLNQDHGSLRQLVRWLGEALPGVYVRNLEVGGGRMDSYFVELNKQVSAICAALASEPALAGGFNAIGLNQGALLMRAYIQRCNSPPVHAYISIGGPQCGVISVPQPHDMLADALLQNGAYGIAGTDPDRADAQGLLSVSQYWRDPYRLDAYLNRSSFLADINNERAHKSGGYKRQLLRLASFVLLMFEQDAHVVPRESCIFSCLAPQSSRRLVPLMRSELFEEDWLGLRALHETGRLHLLRKPGEHLQFNRSFFQHAIVAPFLGELLRPDGARASVGTSPANLVEAGRTRTLRVAGVS
jgi:palmitoyl-protein thioesterase